MSSHGDLPHSSTHNTAHSLLLARICTRTPRAAARLLPRRLALPARVPSCSQHSTRWIAMPKHCSRTTTTSAAAATTPTTAPTASAAAKAATATETTAAARRCGEHARLHSTLHACLPASAALPHAPTHDLAAHACPASGHCAKHKPPKKQQKLQQPRPLGPLNRPLDPLESAHTRPYTLYSPTTAHNSPNSLKSSGQPRQPRKLRTAPTTPKALDSPECPECRHEEHGSHVHTCKYKIGTYTVIVTIIVTVQCEFG